MPPIRSASILLPTRQAGPVLERVLAALARQECELGWDVHVVDAGSTDGTPGVLARARERFPVPLTVRSIHPQEHDAGDTRNLLAAGSGGELLVFLAQDAVPTSPRWLATLARSFDDPRVGAASCRRVPGPDADVLSRALGAADPAPRREARLEEPPHAADPDPGERRRLHELDGAAWALRRELWELHPLPRTAYGEQILMARALLEAGWSVVHGVESAVEDAPLEEPEALRARARLEGRFRAEWLGHVPAGSPAEALELAERQLVHDRAALARAGVRGSALERELERARALRQALYLGLQEGGRSPRRHAPTAMLRDKHLHVLYVVHGFPPDTWAGTEVYTLELARQMQRLGHRVTILARTPGDAPEEEGGPAEFSLLEGEFQGLEVWRLVHRLRHTRMSQSYDEPRAAEAFRGLLARVRPDLVHFQHLIHASVRLVHVAREAGLPTLVHCHDFWPICARVQMIRPDGARCERNQGAGCFLCIRERGLSHIPRVRALGETHRRELEERSRGLRRGRILPRGALRFWEGLDAILRRQRVVMSALGAADLRVSPSRFLRDKLLAEGGLDPEALVYSDNGMRTDHVAALEKAPRAGRRLRVGFVGSLVWYKGTDVLVRALSLLQDAPVEAEIFGDFRPEQDPYHARLRSLAEGVPSVRFRGRFENQRLSEVYAGIDVLAVPSVWYENAPITIREAFLTGTPVVTSALGGMAESVRDGVDGLHFAPGDAADLARVLRRLLEEPGLLDRLSAGAPAVKSIEENARETEFRYRGLLARTDRPWPLLLARDHAEHVASSGEVVPAGTHLTLLRPGAAAEYDLAPAGPGPRRVEVELLALGLRPGAAVGGRAFLDGRPLGALRAAEPTGEDVLRFARLELELAAGGGRLRLEARNAEDARPLQLPIRRIRVWGPPASASLARSPHPPPLAAAPPAP